MDLRAQVRDITERRGLNASQQQAIALAMVSTLTLWQVRPPAAAAAPVEAALAQSPALAPKPCTLHPASCRLPHASGCAA